MYTIILLLCMAIFGSVACTEHLMIDSVNTTKVVDLGYTQYKGVENVDGITSWLGVRYAAPPTGNLRWRAPLDPEMNDTLQDGSKFPPACIGTVISETAFEDEDCLFLNIFVSSNATSESHLPVWFFIPGGGYSVNSDANVNPSELIKQSEGKILFVEVSYRVSAFGFLAGEKVQQDGDLNVGFLDQRKALEWVQKHISKFGGDSNHVVIHGDSAGAGSVAMHLIAYGGRDDNLFKSAILESVFFPTQPKVYDYEFQFNNFLSLSNCSDSNDSMTCLRNTPLSVLKVANSQPPPFPNATSPPRFPYAPCVDGNVITDYPAQLFLDGKFLQVPIMIGSDTDEGNEFVDNVSTEAEMVQYMYNQFPKLSSNNLNKMVKYYPKMPELPLHAPYFPSLALAYGEAVFKCPGLLISSAFYNYSSSKNTLIPIYHYHYNVQDQFYISRGEGVRHVFELQAIFNTFDPATSSYSTYNAPVVPEVRGYWINFVMRSDPNNLPNEIPINKSKINWIPWGAESNILEREHRLLIQTNETRMENVYGDERRRCNFWQEVIYETKN